MKMSRAVRQWGDGKTHRSPATQLGVFSLSRAWFHRNKGVILAMAFKLLLAAEKRWRRINAPHLVALVQAGAKFSDGQWQVLALTA